MHVAVRQIAHSVLGTAKTKLAAGMKLLHSKIQRGRRRHRSRRSRVFWRSGGANSVRRAPRHKLKSDFADKGCAASAHAALRGRTGTEKSASPTSTLGLSLGHSSIAAAVFVGIDQAIAADGSCKKQTAALASQLTVLLGLFILLRLFELRQLSHLNAGNARGDALRTNCRDGATAQRRRERFDVAEQRGASFIRCTRFMRLFLGFV